MVQNPPNPLFGRPDNPVKEGEQNVYDRPQQFSSHPGFYDDWEDRQAYRKSERALPQRERLRPGDATRLYNSLGMSDNLFMVEDARASFTFTPATGTVSTPFSLDRDLILDAGPIPSREPGASVYLGVRGFSATAVATTATGDVAYNVQLGDGPGLLLGTTPASPVAYFVLVGAIVPYPLRPDRINRGDIIGTLVAVGDTIAGAVAIRVALSFTVLYSIPAGR